MALRWMSCVAVVGVSSPFLHDSDRRCRLRTCSVTSSCPRYAGQLVRWGRRWGKRVAASICEPSTGRWDTCLPQCAAGRGAVGWVLWTAHRYDGSGSVVTARIIRVLRYAGRAIILTVAFLYFLIDFIFFSVLRPLRRRLMALPWIRIVREWVAGLNRYVALVLLLVPWLLLEPIKPIAFLLFTRKHHLAATLLIVVGEIIKLTLFEQLFDMTKPKLMTFPWFAWCYGKWRAAIEHVRSLPVWHKMLDRYRTVRARTLRGRIS
jgi:hypothetical protein